MYQLHTLKSVHRDLKKLSKQASARIVNFCLPKLSRNPYSGIQLSGNLNGYFKYVFKFQGVSYRIVYQISEKDKIILVIAIGPRGEFYERLLKRIN